MMEVLCVFQCIVQLERLQGRNNSNVPAVLEASIKIEIAKVHVFAAQWAPTHVRKVGDIVQSQHRCKIYCSDSLINFQTSSKYCIRTRIKVASCVMHEVKQIPNRGPIFTFGRGA